MFRSVSPNSIFSAMISLFTGFSLTGDGEEEDGGDGCGLGFSTTNVLVSNLREVLLLLLELELLSGSGEGTFGGGDGTTGSETFEDFLEDSFVDDFVESLFEGGISLPGGVFLSSFTDVSLEEDFESLDMKDIFDFIDSIAENDLGGFFSDLELGTGVGGVIFAVGGEGDFLKDSDSGSGVSSSKGDTAVIRLAEGGSGVGPATTVVSEIWVGRSGVIGIANSASVLDLNSDASER
eukprot:sb/3469256/